VVRFFFFFFYFCVVGGTEIKLNGKQMRSSSHPVEHTSTIRYETLQLARKKRINEVEL